ncbi:MAG: HD domain-containing phosphohydrolase [Planctomycetota bacterium]
MKTLSAAGLGSTVPRPAETPEELLAGLVAQVGVHAAGVYLIVDGALTHWCGRVFAELEGAPSGALEAIAEGAGLSLQLVFDGDGDVIGALLVRGTASDALTAREGIGQHLEAELTHRGYLGAVFALAEAVEELDEAIAGHVRRISGYSGVIARSFDCEAEFVRSVELASPLHDVGKVAIPDAILYKPDKLSDDEFAETKRHCAAGAEILAHGSGEFWTFAADIAHAHHERWDGSGYPRRLAEEAIPLSARIVAIADVFDALTTKRIYKPALGIEQSLNIIAEGAGRHFDPDLVDAFQRAFSEILDVKTRVTAP